MDQRPGGAPVSSKALLLGLIPVLGLALLANHLMGDVQPPKTDAPRSAPPTSTAATVTPVSGGRVAARKAAHKKMQAKRDSKRLELPDGTFVATLNGAVDAPSMKDFWGPFDWSPIVGTERSSAGVDWYEHADGSFSTTEMVWRPDLGRKAAMTRVAHPGPAPVETSPR
jgi:hypothetical protein